MKSAQELWEEWLEKPCDWDMLGKPIPNKATLGDFQGYVYAGFMAAHQMLTASLHSAVKPTLAEFGEDARDGWISVEERLPEETETCNGRVAALDCDGVAVIGCLIQSGVITSNGKATYWAPIPAAPAMSQDSKGEGK